MIRITVELVPHGIEEGAEVIATAMIANTLEGTWESGHYRGWFKGKGGPLRRFEVGGFPRLRKNVWHLVFLAMQAAGYGGTRTPADQPTGD